MSLYAQASYRPTKRQREAPTHDFQALGFHMRIFAQPSS